MSGGRGAPLLLLLGACAAARPAGDASPAAAPLVLTTLDGAAVEPLAVAPDHVRVLVFVTHDCPIANAYAPVIAALHEELAGSEVDVLLVHTDPDLDDGAARAHAAAYRLRLPIVVDREQRLARRIGASMTPEAAVLTATGVAYLGRIDDRWRGRGRAAQRARRHDLREALADVRSGRPVRMPRTEVVGCFLPAPRR